MASQVELLVYFALRSTAAVAQHSRLPWVASERPVARAAHVARLAVEHRLSSLQLAAANAALD